MTARELKDRLALRYPGGIYGSMPGAWTVIEEYRSIDLLAWSSWSSASNYGRVGHEVKVSRNDLRKELLSPEKRTRSVDWCNEFYFAVPEGLLTKEELAYEEPEWEPQDWVGERCPGFNGVACGPMWSRKKTHWVRVPVPAVTRYAFAFGDDGWQYIVCPTCKGKGTTVASRVEREAPTCWVPRDVGLIVVYEKGGARVMKKSPKRKEVDPLNVAELGQLVRWVSMRPDPRHHADGSYERARDEAVEMRAEMEENLQAAGDAVAAELSGQIGEDVDISFEMESVLRLEID